MRRGEAEDAGGLTPVKDDNEATPHFPRRTLLVFNCFDYTCFPSPVSPWAVWKGRPNGAA